MSEQVYDRIGTREPTRPGFKPWPSHVTLLFCARPDEARRDKMRSIVDSVCDDCGCAIVHEKESYQRCLAMAPTKPVWTVCIACGTQYDMQESDVIVDNIGIMERASRRAWRRREQ